MVPGMCAPRPRTVGLVRSPPTWTVFRQELRVLQQWPVGRLVWLLPPWAMLPQELPLVRLLLLLLLLLRLGPLLVLVACLCAVQRYRGRRRHLLGRGMSPVLRSIT